MYQFKMSQMLLGILEFIAGILSSVRISNNACYEPSRNTSVAGWLAAYLRFKSFEKNKQNAILLRFYDNVTTIRHHSLRIFENKKKTIA